MVVTVIGTNGLLSNSIGRYCNKHNYQLMMFGLERPRDHDFKSFTKIDLLNRDNDFGFLLNSDLIFYAAGAGIQSNLKEKSNLIFDLNVMIPSRMCNYLREYEFAGTFVTFGSYFEIGENSENRCFDEHELLMSQRKVVNDYAISKRMYSRYVSSLDISFALFHFILPTIYGEHEAAHRLIPYTIKALRENTKLGFTSGDQIRQYIYIDEVVEIVFKAVKKRLPAKIYNMAGSETFTVKELVTQLSELINVPLNENAFGKVNRQDTGMKDLQLNGRKLYNAIDYYPRIKLIDVYDKY